MGSKRKQANPSAKMDECMKVLVAKRDNLIQEAEALYQKVFAQSTASAGLLKVNLERCQKLVARFDEIEECMIEANVSSPAFPISVKDERSIFENLTDQIMSRCYDTELCSKMEKPMTSTHNLQPIEIPHFNGTNFNEFWEIFQSLVDKNPILSPAMKYHYLLNSLSESVKPIISGFLPISDENYVLAKNVLSNHFDNPRRIASMHVQNILNVPTMSANFKVDEVSVFVRVFKNNVAALQKMQIKDLCSFILFQICYSKLNKPTRIGFEGQMQHSKEICTLNQLLDFLQSRIQIADLDSIVSAETKPKSSPEQNSKRVPTSQPRTLVADNKSEFKSNRSCPLDNENHLFIQCPKFQAMTVEERIEFMKQNNLCFLCMGKHRRQFCKSTKTCKHCESNKHHGMLCKQGSNTATRAADVDVPASLGCHSNLSHHGQILLSTAVVFVKNVSGQLVPIRCIVDSGSQIQVITEKAVQLLGLSRNRDSTCVQGLGGQSSKVKGVVQVMIRSRHNPNFSLNTKCLVLPRVCGKLPSARIEQQLPDMSYADPKWYIPADVDLLLGAGIYSRIISDSKPSVKLSQSLIAQPSKLGYLLFGQAPDANSSPTSLLSVDDSLHEALERFWKIEENDVPAACTAEEAKAEEFYVSTTYREPDGRYVVRLPFRDDAVPLVENQRVPLLHYQRVEKRLQNVPNNLMLYNQYFSDLLTSGLMSPVSEPAKYLLLHHAVYKQSTTTRIRPVFDASSPDRNGLSLNSQLLPGPALQSDLPHVLLRFRFHAIPLVADIKRMYNSVMIHPDDRKHQHVLWRPNPDADVQEFQLNSVTFGISSSAFLAQRTVKQLVHDEGAEFPIASTVLSQCVYVDDIVCCFPSVATAIVARDQLTELTRRGGFELRKFCSSHEAVLQDVPEEHREVVKFSDGNPSLSVLGTLWLPNCDSFSYSVPQQILESPACTKRIVLSAAARIFDCQGLLTPMTLAIKILLKTLWRSKLNWDEPVPSDIQTKWTGFLRELPLLSELKLFRLIPVHTCQRLELVGFSDGSSSGIGAAIYLRCIQGSTATLHLIKAKSKATPIKPELTIPRTELQASKILVDLYVSLQPVLLTLPISATHFFTDSSIVLCWLRTPLHKLQVFVANRVNQILTATSVEDWHHVNSAANCADPASRSLTPKELLQADLWWSGPTFLKSEPILWPPTPPMPPELPELKREKFCSLIASVPKDCEAIIARFSSFNRMIRVLCWMCRFVNKCRKTVVHSGPLRVPEMQAARCKILKKLQSDYFPEIISGDVCPKQFQPLTPCLDSSGFIRVGGRLANAPLPYDAKHPILIPKESHFAVLLCRDAHRQTLHGGVSLMRTYIQNNYWIVSITRILKKVKRECTRCARLSNKPVEPQMADLPVTRFRMQRAFINVSCDFAGPFNVHEGPRPRAKVLKTYVCVFTCMATRATHLEAVQDLSSDAFLAAVDRLVSRRGLCALLYCDNGTNFVGANRILQDVSQLLKTQGSEIETLCAQRQIQFQFCPPLSPWKNGITERVVGLLKFHLTRVVGNSRLTFSEFTTLIVRIEGVLNSRPLIPLSVDPTDGILTPGHFLIGDSITSVPDRDLTQLKENSLSRWQRTKSLFQSFWRQWRNGYLQTLMSRSKWQKPTPNYPEGTIVMLKGENTPPLQWPLAIVETLLPSKDGTIRVARVRTSTGHFLRPLNKLIPLHVSP